MWVEFVVGSLPCYDRFFPGYSDFPLYSKTNIFKFKFDQKSDRRRTTSCMPYLLITIYLIVFVGAKKVTDLISRSLFHSKSER